MNTIITISREYGAGGHSIGRAVARELGVEIYDKDIIRSTVLQSGLDAGIVEQEEEEISRADAFWRLITPAAYVDRREAIHEIEKNVILMLAKKGPCVILGRCADVILSEADVECLNVFIYADDLHRAVRVSELIGSKNPSDIQRAMKRTDTARRSYYQQFTDNHWGDCRNYNLALDSGKLGYDLCVKLICEAARALDKPE
ncbi:MAG: cytidylate kinase-like family protein [Clostridia bacterium]|nr:cytidylate kinase-like family protein [Clostridia bacterium]